MFFHGYIEVMQECHGGDVVSSIHLTRGDVNLITFSLETLTFVKVASSRFLSVCNKYLTGRYLRTFKYPLSLHIFT